MSGMHERIKWIDAAKFVAWGGGNDAACKQFILL